MEHFTVSFKHNACYSDCCGSFLITLKFSERITKTVSVNKDVNKDATFNFFSSFDSWMFLSQLMNAVLGTQMRVPTGNSVKLRSPMWCHCRPIVHDSIP